MGLVKCPDCGHEVSDKSGYCIFCGCPITKEEIKCPFDFLPQVDDMLQHRYETIEINFKSSSPSIYESIMAFYEQFLKSLILTRKIRIGPEHRTLVAMSREDSVKSFFTSNLGIENTVYELLIKSFVSINEHKHKSELAFNEKEIISLLFKVHAVMKAYYVKYYSVIPTMFNPTYYSSLSNGKSNVSPKIQINDDNFPKKEITSECITYTYRNCKIWLSNRTITKYVGDETRLDLSDIAALKIDKCVFSKNQYLEEIILPLKLQEIGENAFTGCSNLRLVKFNARLSLIKKLAFSGCLSLNNIEFIGSYLEIEYGAFAMCSKLSNISFGSNETQLRGEVFYGCYNLKTVFLKNRVDGWYGCFSESEVFIALGSRSSCPSKDKNGFIATHVCKNAISNILENNDYKYIICESSNEKYIFLYRYKGYGGEINVPSFIEGVKVKVLGPYLFADLSCSSSIELPEFCEEIGKCCIYTKQYIKHDVELNAHLKIIGEYGLASANPNSITIPKSITKICRYGLPVSYKKIEIEVDGSICLETDSIRVYRHFKPESYKERQRPFLKLIINSDENEYCKIDLNTLDIDCLVHYSKENKYYYNDQECFAIESNSCIFYLRPNEENGETYSIIFIEIKDPSSKLISLPSLYSGSAITELNYFDFYSFSLFIPKTLTKEIIENLEAIKATHYFFEATEDEVKSFDSDSRIPPLQYDNFYYCTDSKLNFAKINLESLQIPNKIIEFYKKVNELVNLGKKYDILFIHSKRAINEMFQKERLNGFDKSLFKLILNINDDKKLDVFDSSINYCEIAYIKGKKHGFINKNYHLVFSKNIYECIFASFPKELNGISVNEFYLNFPTAVFSGELQYNCNPIVKNKLKEIFLPPYFPYNKNSN